jgi:putative transposase
MSRSRHTEAEMIEALKQVEAGRKVEDVAREVGVSKHMPGKRNTAGWT